MLNNFASVTCFVKFLHRITPVQNLNKTAPVVQKQHLEVVFVPPAFNKRNFAIVKYCAGNYSVVEI
jgi:hypothetical protein